LCLPHCPTYRKTRDEAESPRGRISLMRALASGELSPSEKLTGHLDLCLACRACERVCPSEVPYGRLIDAARTQLAESHDRVRRRGLFSLLIEPRLRLLAGLLLRWYQRSSLQRLVRASGLLGSGRLAALESGLPDKISISKWQPEYPASGVQRGVVALFTGCVTDLLDNETLRSAIVVLNRLGYRVHVPAGQNCCGALHWHHGNSDLALPLMRKNLAAFGDARYDAVLSCASGCGAMLSEYGQHLAGGEHLAAKTRDITAFLAAARWPEHLALNPLPKRVAVHDACLLRNALREERSPYQLLKRIPGAEIFPLPDNHLCCGAAGSYFLDHRDMAGQLRDDKVRHLRTMAPDILVTTNIGCALHLRAGIRAAGLNIEVVHPVALLARQFVDSRNTPYNATHG
jgi:glycolate oxidase iron-sulfur subunit